MLRAVGRGRRQVGVHDGLQRRRGGEVVERGEGGVHRDPREVGKLGMGERVVASLGRTEKTHVNSGYGSSRGEERDWDGAWKGVVPAVFSTTRRGEDARECGSRRWWTKVRRSLRQLEGRFLFVGVVFQLSSGEGPGEETGAKESGGVCGKYCGDEAGARVRVLSVDPGQTQSVPGE